MGDSGIIGYFRRPESAADEEHATARAVSFGIHDTVGRNEERTFGQQQHSGKAFRCSRRREKSQEGKNMSGKVVRDFRKSFCPPIVLFAEDDSAIRSGIYKYVRLEIGERIRSTIPLNEKRVLSHKKGVGFIPCGPVIGGPFETGELISHDIENPLNAAKALLFLNPFETAQNKNLCGQQQYKKKSCG
jgi:hypothetical protein